MNQQMPSFFAWANMILLSGEDAMQDPLESLKLNLIGMEDRKVRGGSPELISAVGAQHKGSVCFFSF